MTQDELKLVLEALEFIPESGSMLGAHAEAKRLEAITAIKEALAQPEQEPHSWYSKQEDEWMTHKTRMEHERLNSYTHKVGKFDLALYTAPPQRKEQEPVAYLCEPDENGLYGLPLTEKTCTKCFPVYRHPQRPRVVFPTMLRKMWSGSEVQSWLDENVNKENT